MNKETHAKQNKNSIKDLRMYQSARNLEDLVSELVKALPEADQYPFGNGLRRASTACAHYINQSHNEYSFTHKIESLHEARRAAETAVSLLEQYEQKKFGKTGKLTEEYTAVIKQSWGMIKWLRARQEQFQVQAVIKAKDELTAARS